MSTRARAISVPPPIGSLIAGGYRHWVAFQSDVRYRGLLVIHQNALWTPQNRAWAATSAIRPLLARMGHLRPGTLPVGAFVATVLLTDCLPLPLAADVIQELPQHGDLAGAPENWYALRLSLVKALPEPVAAEGAPGIWDVPVPVPDAWAVAGASQQLYAMLRSAERPFSSVIGGGEAKGPRPDLRSVDPDEGLWAGVDIGDGDAD